MTRLPVIESIFNYCTRRCELCPFTERCSVYVANREYEQRHPDATWSDHMRDSFAKTFRLIEAWCKREGVDFAQVCRDGESEETRTEPDRVEETVRADPLYRLAWAYTHAALDVAERLSSAGVLRDWPPGVSAALGTITWHATMVGSKTYRALDGRASHDPLEDDEPVQNDWNGSAKVARILVQESKTAWQAIVREGEAPSDSPIRELLSLLDRIDDGLAERFPRAQQFVRPGFDTVPDPDASPVPAVR